MVILKSNFPRIEGRLKSLGIEYRNITDKDLFPDEQQRPRWADQEALMVEFGLGSADAAILNMARVTHKISGIVTNDGDMVHLFRTKTIPDRVSCYTFIRKFLDVA